MCVGLSFFFYGGPLLLLLRISPNFFLFVFHFLMGKKTAFPTVEIGMT
jgi:hypothetical protein